MASQSSKTSRTTICVSCGALPRSRWRCRKCDALIETKGYRVQETMHVSPRGRVYRAIGPSGKVALKELAFAVVPEIKSIQLFEREADLLRQLEHPRIPRFVDWFEDGEGPELRLYLAQTFVDGEDLEQRLTHHRYDEAEARRIARDVLEILGHLHALSPKLIHRDVKPANIIGGPDQRFSLVDFGSARDLQRPASAGSSIAGTPGYMPPEQFVRAADERSDLYALGMTLARLLSRRSPAELLTNDLKVDLRRYVNASEEMIALLERLVARRNGHGFRSAGEASAELERLPSLARDPKPRPRVTAERPALRDLEPKTSTATGTGSGSDSVPKMSFRWIVSRAGLTESAPGAVAWYVRFIDANEAVGLRPGHSYVVGRDSDADLRIDAARLGADTVSRRHAMLSVRANGLEVVDLGSRNGTRVGLVQVPTGTRGMTLSEGAVVLFGNVSTEIGPLGGY
ncbi:MAG TPA: FHA domain-containing serine/threonine-protein kinase [Myxococcaceae bacterium]|nr:FHA domain-containing serine/threonine-protein kinase [Myxococcaceae bacterium]